MTIPSLVLALFAFLTLAATARADGDPKAGKKVFTETCVLCHGPSGAGDGSAAAAFNPKPANFKDKKRMAGVTMDVRRKAVTEGGAAVGVSANMPAFKDSLSAKQIDDVVAYISTTFIDK